jgi:hypothetical protein
MFVPFNIGVSLSDPAWAAVAPTQARYWTEIAMYTFHCESIIARGSCTARATAALGGAAAPAAPGAAPAAAAGAALRPAVWQQSMSS